MPVYTYRCDSCGVQFERHQSFHDVPLKTCPECRKKTVRRVITPSKVIFKGSGFYANDHKSSSGGGSSKNKTEHSHDHDHDHGSHSHGDESKSADKPAAEKKKSTKTEASE